CDVFLVDDALDVKSRGGLAHIPMDAVHSIEDGNRWLLDRSVVLRLDPPCDGLREVRFRPRRSGLLPAALDPLNKPLVDLRSRIAKPPSQKSAAESHKGYID